MTPQERIAALEGMLDRIRRNVARPRPAAAVVAAPPPVAAAAPAPAPVVSTFDQTVDELLEAPIPLVQTTATAQRTPVAEPLSIDPPRARSHQPPPDAALLEAEEAAIPLVTPAGRDLPAISGVQPVGHAEEAEEEEMELEEGDLISVPPGASPSAPPPAVEIPVHDELDFEDEEEEIPASSQRPRVAASMEEALAVAPEAIEEHEVPIKTPPPESGPQEAMPAPAALESPRLPDIREAFERGPTPEQLGETIELPEPSHAHLELDVRAPEPEAQPVSEELEVSLPTREASSRYDAGLAPPASAREEIRRFDEQAAGEADLEATQIVRRRELVGTAVSRFLAKGAEFTPKSFVDLLEASLRLGGD